MGLSYPASLGTWENDRDGVIEGRTLEDVDERRDVGGGFWVWRTVVVGQL